MQSNISKYNLNIQDGNHKLFLFRVTFQISPFQTHMSYIIFYFKILSYIKLFFLILKT